MATKKPEPAEPEKAYTVKVGLNYPPGDKRAEPGDVVTDLPRHSIRHLLAAGVIEETEPTA